MPVATQSSKPTEFMPRLQEFLASALSLQGDEVKIGTEEAGGVKVHWLGDKSILLYLSDPSVPNKLAGAGRSGFKITRKLTVHVRTRGGLDEAGEDRNALAEHWDFQEAVIDALLVRPHTEDKGEGQFPLVNPVYFLGGGEGVKRIKDSASGYESRLVFELNYVPAVTTP